MSEASYTAWDDNLYEWPPPAGWYQAADGKWWPEGYGPPASGDASTEILDDPARSDTKGAGFNPGQTAMFPAGSPTDAPESELNGLIGRSAEERAEAESQRRVYDELPPIDDVFGGADPFATPPPSEVPSSAPPTQPATHSQHDAGDAAPAPGPASVASDHQVGAAPDPAPSPPPADHRVSPAEGHPGQQPPEAVSPPVTSEPSPADYRGHADPVAQPPQPPQYESPPVADFGATGPVSPGAIEGDRASGYREAPAQPVGYEREPALGYEGPSGAGYADVGRPPEQDDGGGSGGIRLVVVGLAALVALGGALVWFFVFRDDGTDGAAAADVTAATGLGSLDEPYPFLTPVVVYYDLEGSDERLTWAIEVLDPVAPLAGSAEPAPEGQVFAATRVAITFQEGPSPAQLGDLQLTSASSAGTVFDQEADACPGLTDGLDLSGALELGQTREGQLCWVVSAEDLEGLRLAVRAAPAQGTVFMQLSPSS